MDLEKLYEIADREKIALLGARIKNKAIICEVDDEYYIYLNFNKFANSIEEKEIVAEELGHYYCNALYDVASDNENVRKNEYRATKWSFTTLIPPSSILKLEEEGCTYSYEIAEKLGVSENLLNKAYTYYKENNYI